VWARIVGARRTCVKHRGDGYRDFTVQSILHDGPLFEGGRAAPELTGLLRRRDTLIELPAREDPRVLLTVPHHAAPGIDRIAENRPEGGRVADENAVLYALVCLEALRERGIGAALVVAAHATDHDPNKSEGSPYCQRVLRSAPGTLLVECHGASLRAPHDLEISAGRNLHADPLRFTQALVRALGPGFHAAAQIAPGNRAALVIGAQQPEGSPTSLRFPALRTRSLTAAGEAGIAALHVEAKPRFRQRSPFTSDVTAAGRSLGRALAAAIGDHATRSPELPHRAQA
jgi:hypothetical protein